MIKENYYQEKTDMIKVTFYGILLTFILFVSCADRLFLDMPDPVTLYPPSRIYASAVLVTWRMATMKNFASYKIYYDTVPGVTVSSRLATAILYKNDTTYLLTGLHDNTTYYVKTFVYNSTSFNESNEISFATQPCACGSFTGIKQNGMILIPAGCFVGKDNSVATTSYDFFMDTTETTISEWNTIMRTAGIIDTEKISLDKWKYVLKIDSTVSYKPMAGITWYSMILFCNEKSRKNNKDTCYSYSSIIIDSVGGKISTIIDLECDFTKSGFRLATEDEWEYAYYAGRPEEFFWGKDGNTLMESPFTSLYPATGQDTLEISGYVWWLDNNNPNGVKDVAQKKPNRWRLYDIAGNAEEAVWDLSSAEARPKSRIDYTGMTANPQTTKRAIVRGGSFSTGKTYSLTGWWRMQFVDFDSDFSDNIGFRTVRTKVL